ncbi:ABC transporter substrate-binding protein [Paenibacillus sp. CAU 1782]
MSKRTNGIVAMLLAVMLVLAACGGNNDGNAPNAGTTNSADGDGGKTTDLKPYEMTVAFLSIGQIKDLPEVQAEVNKITQAKINATVKFLPIDIGAWQQQMNLMLAGNEPLDILVTSTGLNFGTQAAKGQLVEMDKLLEEYGGDILKVVGGDVIKAGSSAGKIYAVPSVRDWAADYGLVMRKDIVDKYQIDVDAIKSLDDMTAVFQTIKDNEPGMAAVLPEGPSFSVIQSIVGSVIDPLGDENGVLVGFDGELKVVNWYETPEYADLVKQARDWYNAGFIPKDISTNQTTSEQLIKANKAFAFMAHMKPGYESKESLLAGTPLVAARISPAISTTSSIANIMFGIARNSEDPERAMMFLNLLYSDADLVNLIDYGIKGKHYEVKEDNIIGFPAGIDSSNATYNPTHGWMWGNQLLSYIWEGDSADLWTKLDEFNNSAVKSKALGFSFTADPVKTEVAAVQNVKDQFKIGLENGTLDPDNYLPEFIAKLKSAGMDKIVAEKQKQLDEWAAANK